MATSMLKNAITSVVAQVQAIPYAWNSTSAFPGIPVMKALPNSLFQKTAVWNNQIIRQEKGEINPNDYPQAYVEAVLGKSIKLGLGVTQFPEAIFRVHIADWLLDAQDGTEDQNLEVFDWRDLVKSQLQLFFPLYCSALTEGEEKEDAGHEGVYHYIIDFKSCFTDSKGGPLDPNQTKIISIPAVPIIETIEIDGQPTAPVKTLYGWADCLIMATIVSVPDGSTQVLPNGDVIPLQYALNNDGYQFWIASTNYGVGQQVNYGNSGYICTTANSDSVFNPANWSAIPPVYPTLTIPELASYPGITVLTPFLLNNNTYPVGGVYNATENKFDLSIGNYGYFNLGDVIEVNASLPLFAP